MKTAFELLSDLHCKVIVAKDDPPFQWIYAVDDAWFHPANWTLQIKEGEKLQEVKPLFTSGNWSKEPIQVGAEVIQKPENAGNLAAAPNPRSVETTTPPPELPPEPGSFAALIKVVFNTSHGDAYTARELIKFIQKRHAEGLNYGLCFCTFEYFWENIEVIDQPQNAVFFDIRHALANQTNTVNNRDAQAALLTKWNQMLDNSLLFASDAGKPLGNYDMSRLGWYLHYALKFGKIGGKGASRCELLDNHIQIISSAINPDKRDGSESLPTGITSRGPGVMNEYTEVQTAIWNAKRTSSDSIDDIKPDRFTFSPIPKGDALETGLKIFNNSFKEAGTWEGVQKLLFHDAGVQWTNNGQWGHKPIEGLKWTHWYSDTEARRPLYIIKEDDFCVKYRYFKALLKHSMVHRHFMLFEVDLPDENFQVCIPTNPTIVWIATLIDFLDALKPRQDNGIMRPKPRLHISRNNGGLDISVTLGTCDITGFKKSYDDQKANPGSATAALLHLVVDLGNISEHHFNSGQLKQMVETSSHQFQIGTAPTLHLDSNPITLSLRIS